MQYGIVVLRVTKKLTVWLALLGMSSAGWNGKHGVCREAKPQKELILCIVMVNMWSIHFKENQIWNTGGERTTSDLGVIPFASKLPKHLGTTMTLPPGVTNAMEICLVQEKKNTEDILFNSIEKFLLSF